jgi:hypothetical protein
MKLSPACAVALLCLVVVGSVGIANCQTWTAVTNKPPVSFGTELLLTDGRVLLHEESGKDFTTWYTLTPDNTGSYINGTFAQVGSFPNGYAPLDIASAVLADGKVIIQGGEYQCPAGSCTGVWQSNGALYDPVKNIWTSTVPPISAWIGDAESIVLPNGTFMLAACCAQFEGITPYPDYFYFNESTLSYTSMASATDGETTEFDEAGWALLPNGKVLMVNVYLGAFNATAMGSSIYDPATNTWADGGSTQVQLWDDGCGNSATASYELGPMVLMPNGTVFATGASNCQAGNMATYNVSTGVWTALPPYPGKSASNDAPASIEINGNVIVSTSPYTNTFSTPVQFYEWNGSVLSTFPNPPNASKDDAYYGNLLVLPSGQILYTDRSTTGMAVLTSAGTYQAAWQPTISSAPSSLSVGGTYPISGTQFNGLSQGAFYGDDVQMNTNYPLVRIVNNNTGHVFYARTHDHSTMGVATGSTPVSTNFDVPNMETGPCELYVVANGIPSAASTCDVELPAGIYVPTNGASLTNTTTTFQWGGYSGATAYWLDIGSSLGGNNIYSSGSLSSSTLSLAVSSLPSDGSTIWVRWYEQVSGSWQSTDYSYSALGGPTSLGFVQTPVPGATLTSSAPAFTWSLGTGATAYYLNIGSTSGGNNYYSSGNLGNVATVTTKGLPTNGSTVYATLYSLVGGTWYSHTYTYTAFNTGSSIATISTPTPGSTFTGSSVTFTWASATGAQAYWVDIGSTSGAHDISSSGSLTKSGTTHTLTVNTLPTNGSAVYVTLYTELSSVWTGNTYQYTAFNLAGSGGVLTSPAAGSTLTGSSVTFGWTAGASATAYWIDVGSTTGGHNYFSSGNLGNVLTETVSGLPTDGSAVYVTLYSLIGSSWTGNTYSYTALNATSGLAAITSPTNGALLSGNSVTFTWGSDSNATGYWVDVSAVGAGGNDLDSSGNLGLALTETINNLPANGGTVYVTLYSLVGGQWLSRATTYTSGP